MKLRALLPRQIRAPLGIAGRRCFAALAGPLQPAVPEGSVLALCHCHYPDLVPELATRLLSLPRGAALHVTASDPAVFAAWDPYRRRSRVPIRFHETENRGRDLLPFVTVARSLAIAPDAAVLKIHGKRSAYVAAGDWWRRDMLRGLFPGPFAARRALVRFAADPRLALLGAPGTFIGHPVYWGRNRDAVTTLMRAFTGTDPRDEDLAFFAGTMFWIRGGFLAELLASHRRGPVRTRADRRGRHLCPCGGARDRHGGAGPGLAGRRNRPTRAADRRSGAPSHHRISLTPSLSRVQVRKRRSDGKARARGTGSASSRAGPSARAMPTAPSG